MEKLIKYIDKNLFKVVYAAVFGMLIVALWVQFVGISTNFGGAHFNKDTNAIWIGHQWVGEQKSVSEIEELVANLQEHGFTRVFVHSGPFKSDGSIDPQTYRYSIDFVEVAKGLAPEIEFQAWLGQLRGRVDLDDPSVRKNMVNQAIIMTQMVGFDGIHYDIEPVWDGDEGFIKLLEETREAIGEELKISVALAEFIPGSVIWFFEEVHEFRFYSTEVNYENVAEFADQIVVMTYDTSFDDQRLYEWLVAEQTIWVSELFKNTGKEVFIAIPAYDDETEAFDPKVENIETGLNGILDGLNNLRAEDESFTGVAIYPYWYMDEGEWQTYREIWLNK